MKVTYRVISNITGNDLTDKERWVLEPDGTVKYKRGDSLYEDEVKAVFNIENSNSCEGCKHIGFRYPYASMYPCNNCRRANSKDYYNMDLRL